MSYRTVESLDVHVDLTPFTIQRSRPEYLTSSCIIASIFFTAVDGIVRRRLMEARSTLLCAVAGGMTPSCLGPFQKAGAQRCVTPDPGASTEKL